MRLFHRIFGTLCVAWLIAVAAPSRGDQAGPAPSAWPTTAPVRSIARGVKVLDTAGWGLTDSKPKYPPGKFFAVRQIDGIWWFIDPNGEKFYGAAATNCLGYYVGFQTPERDPQDFENAEPYAKRLAPILRHLGFNCTGSWGGNLNDRFPAMPVIHFHTAGQWTGISFGKLKEHPDFPDVFSPEFEASCRAWAERFVKPFKDSPLIIGWFLDNELPFPRDPAVIEQYFKVTAKAVRDVDPNHLILGTRFQENWSFQEAWEIAGRYCDVLSANIYGWAPDRQQLEVFYGWGKRPIVIGEFSFAASDAGLPDVSTSPVYVATQAQRGKGYAYYTTHFAALPFALGAHYYTLRDSDFEGGLCNSGVFDENYEFMYVDFARWVRKANLLLPEIHAGRQKPLEFADLEKMGGRRKWHRSYLIVRAPEQTKIDGIADEWAQASTTELEVLATRGDTPAPDDSSAGVQLMWDDEALYALFRVTDDRPGVNPYTGSELWQGDAIEFFLSSRDARDESALWDRKVGDLQVCISPGDRASNLPPQVAFIGPHAPASAATKKVRYAVRINDGQSPPGYWVEIALPWRLLNIRPSAEHAIRMDFAVDDADAVRSSGKVMRESQITWNAGPYIAPQPLSWGVGVLKMPDVP